MKKPLTVAAALAACASLPAQAHDFDVRLSGFGTVGLVQTDTDDAQLVRDGQLKGASKEAVGSVDSMVGVQVTAKATSWLSGTVQMLAAQRDTSTETNAAYEWAFIKVTPVKNLAVRVGRTSPQIFAISDFRNVGYANTWVRPPNEVYSLAMLHRLDGADVTYRLPIGSSSLTTSIFGGDSELGGRSSGAGTEVKKVKGFDMRWEYDWLTLRVGSVQGDAHLQIGGPTYVPQLGITIDLPYSTLISLYKFSGVGAIVDTGKVLAQSEYVVRDAGGNKSRGWYVLGGYRINSVVPYASYAVEHGDGSISGDQNTAAIGVRWEAFSSAVLKAQVEHIDPKGTQGISFVNRKAGFGNDSVNALSLAIDFVF